MPNQSATNDDHVFFIGIKSKNFDDAGDDLFFEVQGRDWADYVRECLRTEFGHREGDYRFFRVYDSANLYPAQVDIYRKRIHRIESYADKMPPRKAHLLQSAVPISIDEVGNVTSHDVVYFRACRAYVAIENGKTVAESAAIVVQTTPTPPAVPSQPAAVLPIVKPDESGGKGGADLTPKKPGSTNPADNETNSAGSSTVTWQFVAASLDVLRLKGEAFKSQGYYAEMLHCSPATVNKAIQRTPSLNEWAQRPVSSVSSAMSLGGVILDNVAQRREPEPANTMEPADEDYALRYLMEQASPVERARISEMSPDERRLLAETAYRDPDLEEKIWRARRRDRREHARDLK